MELRRQLRIAFIFLFIVLAISVTGYRLLGGPSVTFLDALYMAIITLSSVGYTEIVDTAHNPILRAFNIFVIIFGVMIMLYVFSVVTAFLVEGEITSIFWRRRMLKRISDLKDHYIVCGLGDTGRHAVEELARTHAPFVVIETNEDHIKRVVNEEGGLYREMLYVVGDATDADMLDKLGIDAYIAVDKDQHNRQAASPRGRIPKSAGPRERMRRKTRTKKGRAVYKRRKHVAEPPFGFIKQGLGFRQFLLRGLENVSGEWKLVTLAYNLRRLHDSGRWRSASAIA